MPTTRGYWVASPPDDAALRIPNGIENVAGFLCVKDGPRWRFGGTAFFVAVEAEPGGNAYTYLVTAKHCVDKAAQYGPLYLRLNTVDGDSDYIQLQDDWYFPDKEGPDVAVLGPVEPARTHFSYLTLSESLFPRTDFVKRLSVGIGDDLAIIGLFRERQGKMRNLPIVRSGIIAAMPSEPFQDDGGFDYHAYLAEVRSIGGLSGSPVLVIFEAGRENLRPKQTKGGMSFSAGLLGFIRGHWNYEETSTIPGTESENMNLGIALVTPFADAEAILYREDLVKERRRLDRERQSKTGNLVVEDSVINPVPKKDFEKSLRKVSDPTKPSGH